VYPSVHPWNGVLFEKMIVAHQVKKFPTYCGTRGFIAVFIRAHHWTLSWTWWIQSISKLPCPVRFILLDLVTFEMFGSSCSFLHIPVITSGPTQPPIQLVTGALSLGVKRPAREADHLPPSSAEVKNAWNYTSTPPILLHGMVLS
jgi:hypothetical protein